MTRPLTMAEADARGLLAANGVPVFATDDDWQAWADSNCDACPFFGAPGEGRACALPAAFMYAVASAELAGLFGFGHRTDFFEEAPAIQSWVAPERCAFLPFDGDGDDWTPVPAPTPGGVCVTDDPAALFEAMQRPPAEPFTVAG